MGNLESALCSSNIEGRDESFQQPVDRPLSSYQRRQRERISIPKVETVFTSGWETRSSDSSEVSYYTTVLSSFALDPFYPGSALRLAAETEGKLRRWERCGSLIRGNVNVCKLVGRVWIRRCARKISNCGGRNTVSL